MELFQHFGGQQLPQIINSSKPSQEDQFHILAFKEKTPIWKELCDQEEIKIFAQSPSLSDERTFICGKISLEDFASPAVQIKWNNNPVFEPFSGHGNLIGAFYPLVI
jgi:hypothetical protein